MRHSFNGDYNVTREYGVVNCQDYGNYPDCKHPGTDYGVPANTPLVAGMSGKVTGVFKRQLGRGWEVVIANGDIERKTLHMNRIDVSMGQQVTEGQQIGLSGYTGYVLDSQGNVGTPGGAHLHDELVISGQYRDLEKFLKQGEVMPPAPYETARIYAQKLLFRDMPRDEWEKFHKDKNRDQLFDAFSNAPERAENLAKLIKSDNADADEESKKLREALKNFLD